MEQILNFRLVADGVKNNQGKTIKNIYRSADVSNATASDIEELLDNGITNIIDLRSAQEITKVLTSDQIKVENIEIIDNGKQNEVEQFSPTELANIMINLYQKEFVNTDGFKQELDYILGLDGAPFLFHCTAGKDRTGITAVILMHILGFTYEDIKREYLEIDEILVNAILNKILKYLKEEDALHVDSIRAIASVNEDFLEAYLLGITDQFGTIDKYVESKLQISDEDINRLKDYYLE